MFILALLTDRPTEWNETENSTLSKSMCSIKQISSIAQGGGVIFNLINFIAFFMTLCNAANKTCSDMSPSYIFEWPDRNQLDRLYKL